MRKYFRSTNEVFGDLTRQLLGRGRYMKKQFPDLPTRNFDMDEVSAGVYEVIVRDDGGHTVSAKGGDLDSLLEECRKAARKISMIGPVEKT
jgi:hypothetical protein